jgi:hypothetical protein
MTIEQLTIEHMRVILVVYISAIGPLLLIPFLLKKKLIPSWVPVVYLASFFACAVGWELWFTYGWLDIKFTRRRRLYLPWRHFIAAYNSRYKFEPPRPVALVCVFHPTRLVHRPECVGRNVFISRSVSRWKSSFMGTIGAYRPLV